MRLIIFLFSFTSLYSYYRKRVKSPIVLFWHDVSHHASQEVEGESFPTKLFERQIKYLVRHYEVISMDEYHKRYKEHSFSNREIVITFDDGYHNNLLVAAPILKKYNLPFTVFISANNVETRRRFYVSIPRLVIIGAKLEEVNIPQMSYRKTLHTDKERIQCANEIEYKIKYFPHDKAVSISKHLISLIGRNRFDDLCRQYPNGELLSWEDIKKLANDYNCTIGSHCLDHCVCHCNQHHDLVSHQIIDSKALIEKRTGLKCNYFAYPNGDHTPFSDSIVEKNYKLGFTTERIPAYTNTNLASVGRIAVQRSYYIFKYSITVAAFKAFNRK